MLRAIFKIENITTNPSLKLRLSRHAWEAEFEREKEKHERDIYIPIQPPFDFSDFH